MSRAQLVHVAARAVLQRDRQCIRRDCHAPERIAQLERQGVAVEWPSLQEVLPDVGEHLASLLGQSSRRVEQPLVFGQLPPDRAPGFRLILGQRGGARDWGTHAYVTRGSAFAYARSVRRLTSTNTADRKSTDPWIAGRSRRAMALTTYRPRPGHEKMVSVR